MKKHEIRLKDLLFCFISSSRFVFCVSMLPVWLPFLPDSLSKKPGGLSRAAALDLQSGFGDLCAETDETLRGSYFAAFASRERQ